jgi:alpha-tubulin suppressor-like RCC1 family protein
MSMCRAAIGIAAAWVCAAAPVWGAERIYLLEQQARDSAPYLFRSLGEIEGARRAAVPETGGHVLVLTSLGRVWGWGQNLHGQLGTGDRAARPGFIEVPGLSDVTAISAGAQHSVALKSDGTVWTWGANTEGQLGDGSLVNRMRPGIVPELRDVSMIAAGALFTVALKSDGTVWAFGSNWNGIAGSDARKLVTEPVRVEGLSDVRAVGTRLGVGYALDGQGRIWVWGRGVENAAGTPRVLSEEERPVGLELEFAGSRLSAEWLGMGIDGASGRVWLRDSRGSRAFAIEGTAVHVAAGWAVVVVAGGAALDSKLTDETKPELDDPRSPVTLAATVPQRMAGSVGATSPAIVRIAAGGTNTFLVRADGSVRSAGGNLTGVLGDGTTSDRYTPSCTLLTEVQSVSSVGYHALALKNDSTVWAWGQGQYGSLGRSSPSNRA